jgi:ketosteroid isomerase-like protein
MTNVADDPQAMDDEYHLRDIQQQLARAWVERDRAFIERILAPEWSVTQANGSILSRANMLRSAFETEALQVKSMVIDDVTLSIFGTTAVIRGRTAATGTDKDLAFDVRMRFTDVFLKRNGEWQAVASHASFLAQ